MKTNGPASSRFRDRTPARRERGEFCVFLECNQTGNGLAARVAAAASGSYTLAASKPALDRKTAKVAVRRSDETILDANLLLGVRALCALRRAM